MMGRWVMPSDKQSALIVERAGIGLAMMFGLGTTFAVGGCASAMRGLEAGMVAVDIAADELAAQWEEIAAHEQAYCRQMPDYDACMAQVRAVGEKLEKGLEAAVVGQESMLKLLDAYKEMQALECGRHPEKCKQ